MKEKLEELQTQSVDWNTQVEISNYEVRAGITVDADSEIFALFPWGLSNGYKHIDN